MTRTARRAAKREWGQNTREWLRQRAEEATKGRKERAEKRRVARRRREAEWPSVEYLVRHVGDNRETRRRTQRPHGVTIPAINRPATRAQIDAAMEELR